MRGEHEFYVKTAQRSTCVSRNRFWLCLLEAEFEASILVTQREETHIGSGIRGKYFGDGSTQLDYWLIIVLYNTVL